MIYRQPAPRMPHKESGVVAGDNCVISATCVCDVHDLTPALSLTCADLAVLQASCTHPNVLYVSSDQQQT